MASKTRKRDYRREYLNRIIKGLARGRSRAEARGHARASDLTTSPGVTRFNKDSPLEKALKLMRRGATQREAAEEVGVSAERLRRYQRQNTTSERQRRRWIIFDTRPVPVFMATRGKMREVTVPHNLASEISRHWIAVNKFLETNDPSHLSPFVGKGLRDQAGEFHPYETRPNVLRRLDSIGEMSFIDIYSQTVQ